MEKDDKKKIIEVTKPKPPDPKVLEELQKKKEEEDRKKKEEAEKEPQKGTRGPKSKLVLKAEEEAANKEFRERCRKSGRSCCSALVMTGYTFLGPEWAYIPPVKINPDDPNSPIVDEKTRMEGAYADMFEAYGWDVIPPWVPVLTVTLTYGAVRLNMPSVKERLKGGGIWKAIKERLKAPPKKEEEKK